MTTSGGSVWDRGPSDDEHADAASTDDGKAAPGEGPADEHDVAPGDPSPDPVVDTVWDRGPSIDEVLVPEPPGSSRPTRPEPVLPQATPRVNRARSHREVRRPVAVSAAAASLVALAALAWSLGVVGGDDGEPALAGDTGVLLEPAVPPSAAPATSTVPAATNTSLAVTTTSSTTTSSTTTTTSTPTSTSTTSSTTTSSTTTSSTTTSSTSTSTVAPEPVPAGGPQVAIAGRVGPCKFGSDCLIADFTISGFDTAQREFVCEFANGGRYTFRFDGVGADGACATSAADGAITIEVAGVRSETITR